MYVYCIYIYNHVLGYSLTPPTLFFEVKMAPPFEHGFMTESLSNAFNFVNKQIHVHIFRLGM